MRGKDRWIVAAVAAAVVAMPIAAAAQVITLPPDGKNQKASVSQWIGLVEVDITYNAPKVTAPDGTDRTGKIWGQLVPFGMTNLGFGTCGDQCPWRGGANENTVFRVSKDVKIEGQPLPAGSYGLHFIPGREEWTVIFSKNYTSWGSFFYKQSEDQLRVNVKPKKCEFNYWLTYEFTERQPERATAALKWEYLEVPWVITVDNATELYVEKIREELRTTPGFNWEGWQEAADFCLNAKTNLKEALGWAQNAVSLQFVGQENFVTLRTLADLQAANGLTAEAQKTWERAIDHPTASVMDLHQYGRQLQGRGENEKALKVFELNAKKHPGVWPVNVGLARGYAAVGKTDEALKYAKLAVKEAPDEANRKNLEKMVESLQAAKAKK